MSDIISTVIPNATVFSSLSDEETLSAHTTNVGATTLSQLTDVDLQGVSNGSLLIYDTNEFVSRSLTGAISVNVNGLTSVNPNAVTLGTHTTGSYVANVFGTANQIISSGGGTENATITLSLPQSIGIASSPTFADITISGAINNTALNVALANKQPLGNYATGGGVATGVNTGDETEITIKSKLGISTLSGSNTGDQDLSALVPKTTTVNGKALNSNITLNKTDIGLSSVDNTADTNKPISTAQQTALNLKASLSGATFTGTVNLNSVTNINGYAELGADLFINDASEFTFETPEVRQRFRDSIALGNVNNTSDANKPVSTAQQTALDLKANLNGATFTGIVNAPTAAVDTSTTQIATTAFAKKEADDAQAAAVQRSNHTGTQDVSTITGLGSLATQSGTFSGTSSGTNTGDQDLNAYALKSEIFDGYDYEIHVSQVDGDDGTGNGDLLTPVASITKALTLLGGARKTIIVHPGTYTENPSITVQYTTITGPGLIGANIVIAGTLSTSTGCTIAGLKMTNLTVTASAGTGNVNILNCEISGTFTKNSNATYTTMRLCDIAAANITGSGLVSFFGGNPNLLTVNNAAANVIVKGAVSVSPTLTAGNLNVVDSVVVASGTYAISSAASSFITVANSQILVSALNDVAPVSLLGFYSIFNCVYNKPGSILAATSGTGGSTNSIDYFQYINADKFITQGGTSSQFVKGDGSLDSVAKANLSGASFSGAISATNLSGTNTGDETVTTIKSKLGISTLSGSNTGDQTITLTGDVSGSGTGSFTTTLKNVGTAGTYNNSATGVQPFTTDAAGRISAAGATITITPAWSNVTSTPTTIAGYGITDAVQTSGNQNIDGVKTFTESPSVPNLTTQSSSTSVVNKAYADNIAAGIHVHAETHLILKSATLAAATGGTVTYTNGTNGVGAKLTVTGGSTVIDALNAAEGPDTDLTSGVNGSRVIIANETNAAHNGIYTISGARELTRATDADSPAKMNGGDFVFVTHGTTYANTSWIVSEPVTIVGTFPVIFLQFSGAGAYTVGTGLTRDGTVFSITNTGVNIASTTYGSGTSIPVLTVNPQGQITSASTVAVANDSTKANLDSPTFTGTVTSPVFSGALTGNVTGNVSGSAASFTGSLSGDVTGTQAATAIAATTVTGKALTGYVSGSGAVSATDTILTAINKLDGNISLKASLTGASFTGAVSSTGAITGTNLVYKDGNTDAAALTVGTTDANSFIIKTNNTSKVTVLSEGNVGVGTSSPAEKLEVIGSISANSTSNTYTLQNKNASALQSAFERVRGWLVWSYNSFIGRLKTADITAAREWLLPNSSGTIPITTLTSGSVSAEETFRTALYREMMWIAMQARKLVPATTGATYGTNSAQSATASFISATTGGNSGSGTIGSRATCLWEFGMSQQQGAGASWKIPTSFSATGAFFSLLGWASTTSNNITQGSNTFTLTSANSGFVIGHRIYNSNFPSGTRITNVVGAVITVDQNATTTGAAGSAVNCAYDGVNRIILGTRNDITTFNAQCCGSVPTTAQMLVVGGYASGATQITVNAPITFTASGTSGNTFITTTATPTNVVTGMIVSGNGIPANTIVTSVAGTQVNLNTTLAGNVTSITVGFAPTMIATSNTAMAPAAYIASGTSGNNYITLTTTPIGFSAGYIVAGNGITAGTTITSIAGNQVNLSTTLAGDVTSISVTFMQSSATLAHAYAYGIPDNTRISSITSSTTSSNILINLNAAVTGDARYNTGLVGQVGTPFVYAASSTAISGSACNNIFIEYIPNPSTGKIEIRIGYQRAGRMFYSSTAPFPEGEMPANTYSLYFQFILDYSSTTNQLRLWANRNANDGTAVPSRPLQSNVLITLATPSDLVQQNTAISWGVQSCDDGVRAPFTQNYNTISWKDAYYYPFTTAA